MMNKIAEEEERRKASGIERKRGSKESCENVYQKGNCEKYKL